MLNHSISLNCQIINLMTFRINLSTFTTFIFGREGAYSQRFTVYVKRGPDTPTKKPASGQCPRPFLSLPCGISLNQAMRLSVVFGLKCNLVWQVLFLFCSIMADVEDLVSSKKKSNTKRKATVRRVIVSHYHICCWLSAP